MSLVQGDTITVFDGMPHSVKIADGDTAAFSLVVPAGVTKFAINWFQKGDDTDRTPRTSWISTVPGYTAAPEKRPPPDGLYPSGQFAYQTSTGQLNCVVDGVSGLQVAMNGSHMEMHAQAVGSTIYLTAQNTQTGKHPNTTPQNFSVTVSAQQ